MSMPRASSKETFVFRNSTPYAALLRLSVATAACQERCRAAGLDSAAARDEFGAADAAEADATATGLDAEVAGSTAAGAEEGTAAAEAEAPAVDEGAEAATEVPTGIVWG